MTRSPSDKPPAFNRPQTAPTPPNLRIRLRRLLQRLELAGQHQRAALARRLRVRQIELTALEHLVVTGGLTPGELGHRLGLTSGGTTALAHRLRGAGYIGHSQHPRDRRIRILTATATGETLVAKQLAPIAASAEQALAAISDSDAETLERVLAVLVLVQEHAAADMPTAERTATYEPTILM